LLRLRLLPNADMLNITASSGRYEQLARVSDLVLLGDSIRLAAFFKNMSCNNGVKVALQ